MADVDDSGYIELLQIGSTLAERYLILKCIYFEGIDGIIYKAFDLESGCFVALKVMREPGTIEDRNKEFMTEVSALRNLSSSAIVVYLDYALMPENHNYIVMEFLDGLELYQLVRMVQYDLGDDIAGDDETYAGLWGISGFRLTWPAVLSILAVCLSGLKALRSQGFSHGDLYAENVMLSLTGLKLVDFSVIEYSSESVDQHTLALVAKALLSGKHQQYRGLNEIDLVGLPADALNMLNKMSRGSYENLEACEDDLNICVAAAGVLPTTGLVELLREVRFLPDDQIGNAIVEFFKNPSVNRKEILGIRSKIGIWAAEKGFSRHQLVGLPNDVLASVELHECGTPTEFGDQLVNLMHAEQFGSIAQLRIEAQNSPGYSSTEFNSLLEKFASLGWVLLPESPVQLPDSSVIDYFVMDITSMLFWSRLGSLAFRSAVGVPADPYSHELFRNIRVRGVLGDVDAIASAAPTLQFRPSPIL